MADISEDDVLRNAHAAGSISNWMKNPTPGLPEKDPQTILDTDDATADAYLWNTNMSKDAWLQFEGELADLTR